MTREVLPELADAADAPRLAAQLQELWDDGVQESKAVAARMRRLDGFWSDGSISEAAVQARDEADMRVAIALRVSPTSASHFVHEAHLVLTDLPRTFAHLESGRMPWPWMRRLIRAVRDLEAEQRHRLDAMVAAWDVDVTYERFRKDLALAAARVRSSAPLAPEAPPSARRRVEVHPEDDEGMACLRVLGPVPDVMALARRLDASARAVQAAQRRALEVRADGDPAFPIPFDDGTIEAAGRALSLARLRFDLMTRTPLDTGGVEVSPERFRINVVVPAMTLLGASDAPGTLDGTIPVPADLARSLAGGETVWHRVLTDPASGAFLPLPADRHVPSPAMREHLRLRGSTCAAPGCTRPSSWASECDHIEEYDHRSPDEGGRTEIENLHLLCWQHHLLKTRRRIDPVRLSPERVMRATSSDSPDPPTAPMASCPPSTSAPPMGSPPSRPSLRSDQPEPSDLSIPAGLQDDRAWEDGSGPCTAEAKRRPRSRPGATRWRRGDGSIVDMADDVDLLTPAIVDELEMHWRAHTELERQRSWGAETRGDEARGAEARGDEARRAGNRAAARPADIGPPPF